MPGEDVPSLPSSSAHRLPTVSASDALQSLHRKGSRAVSTGLPQLDKLLAPHVLPGHQQHGGLVRGKVTEVYGPSGVGKTAFGVQAAASALREKQSVVWVEAGAPLVPQRLNAVLAGTGDDVAIDDLRERFHHCTAPTLAHLLALFTHPPSSFPPANTSLVVIDSLSTLIDDAYPRNADNRASRNKGEQAKWAAARKLPVINELISTLSRVAAMHDIALLVACQTATRIRGASRALLVPSISGSVWEDGISTRLVLFRDWAPVRGKTTDVDVGRLRKARFIGLVKANGVTLANEGGVGNVVPFAIEQTGLCDITVEAVDIATHAVLPSEGKPPKRPFAEVADSDEERLETDESFGWDEDDEVAAEGLLVDEADPAPT